MIKITTLTLTIATLFFTPIAHSGPCYTDASCDLSDEVVMVVPKKNGEGFCLEFSDKEHKKTNKCYFQPPRIAASKSIHQNSIIRNEEFSGIYNLNLVHTSNAEPYIYSVPRENRTDEYYNGYHNPYNGYDQHNSMYNQNQNMVNNNNSSNSNSPSTSHSYKPEGRTVTFQRHTNNISQQDINQSSSPSITYSRSNGNNASNRGGRTVTFKH